MSDIHETGKIGEQKACKLLENKGYHIVKTNWRFGSLEIDIIAENDEYIVFVEVKTRSSNRFGEPAVFVNKTKQKQLIKAAQAYIERNKIDKEARFDIISVLTGSQTFSLQHIESAFYPGIK
jgi:putative endonuclease